MNYESASSDEDDAEQFENAIKEQRDLVQNEAWGAKKANFYGRNKGDDEDSDTSDDEDENLEAARLQQIRAKKMQHLFGEQQVESSDAGEDDQQNQGMDTSSDEEEGGKKLGDKLFEDI